MKITSYDALYTFYGIARNSNSYGHIVKSFEELKEVNKTIYTQLGGTILSGDPLDPPDHPGFDNSYYNLITIIANFNVNTAIDIHETKKELYELHSRSFVRYNRISTSLKNSLALIKRLDATPGLVTSNIKPALTRRWENRLLEINDLKSQELFSKDCHSQPITYTLPLQEDQERILVRTDENNDDYDEYKKIATFRENLTSNTSNTFSIVQDVKICSGPTNLIFKDGDCYSYFQHLTDMYHYTRMTGRVVNKHHTKPLDCAFYLPRIGANNYYHSIADRMPALWAYKMMGLDCPVISTYEFNALETELSRRIGIDCKNIIYDKDADYVSRTGIVPDTSSFRISFYRTCRTFHKNSDPDYKKIYISRSKSASRPLTNESTVEEFLVKHGYKILYMENLSIEEQITAASSSKIIIGPHGAGLANMVFSEQGCKIIELVPNKYPIPLFRQLAIDCGHHYSPLIGKVSENVRPDTPEKDFSWEIPIDKLDRIIQGL